MLRGRVRRRKAMSEINVVPYIDVMLVLLVIFMITAPLLNQGIQVNLPQAQTQTLPGDPKAPLIVSVNAQGAYFLNISKTPDVPMDPATLVTAVQTAVQTSATQHIVRDVWVKGDRTVNYAAIIELMALLQQAGASHVGLMTDPAVASILKKG